MQRLHGTHWRALLEELQAEEADEEEVDAASAISGGAPATPQRLRQTLLEEFDAAAGTSTEYQERMDFVMEQLESLGEPVTPGERMKVALRREYGELIAGQAQQEQKKQLKLVFEEVLLGGEGRYSPEEHNARLEVLVDLLKTRGSGLQHSGKALFSSDGDESSPGRPARPPAVSEAPTARGARSSDNFELREELVRLRRDLDEERARRDRDSGCPVLP